MYPRDFRASKASVCDDLSINYKTIIYNAINTSSDISPFVVNAEIPLALGLPRLSIEGIGRIAFPLLASQAKEIIEIAELAPFGLGQETLLDTTVRNPSPLVLIYYCQ